jgi:hypothetical protein
MTKNCCGPFKYGRPGKALNPKQQCFVDCCGNMCPPEDCCDIVLVYFKCGSKNPEIECCPTIEENLEFQNLLLNKKNIPPIPKFNLTEEEQGESFNLLCSIPCSQTILTLTTSGCCIYMEGNSIYAVGDGEITFTLSEELLEGCGELLVSINKTKTYEHFLITEEGNPLTTENGAYIVIEKTATVQVKDGEEIIVSIKATEDDCCECCEIKKECDPENSMWLLKEKNNKKVLYLNKNKFIKNLNILRKQKVLRKIKKLKSK